MQSKCKFIFCLFIMIFGSCLSVFSQTAKERYDKGVKFMNQKIYSDAIKWFKSSKGIEKSPDNQSRCNTKIKECNSEISRADRYYNSGIMKLNNCDRVGAKQDFQTSKTIDKSPSNISRCDKGIRRSEIPCDEPDVKLEIDKKDLIFPANQQKAKVTIKGDPWPNWDFEPDRVGWLHVERGNNPQEEVYLTIWCDNNIDTYSRKAQIVVTAPKDKPIGKRRREIINITQMVGAPVAFYVDGDVNYPNVRRKGEQIIVKLSSNSMVRYAENNNRNWRVISMPSWCHHSNQKKDKDGYGVAAQNELVVIIDANKEKREREGVIRLESQGVFAEIKITQKK